MSNLRVIIDMLSLITKFILKYWNDCIKLPQRSFKEEFKQLNKTLIVQTQSRHTSKFTSMHQRRKKERRSNAPRQPTPQIWGGHFLNKSDSGFDFEPPTDRPGCVGVSRLSLEPCRVDLACVWMCLCVVGQSSFTWLSWANDDRAANCWLLASGQLYLHFRRRGVVARDF